MLKRSMVQSRSSSPATRALLLAVLMTLPRRNRSNASLRLAPRVWPITNGKPAPTMTISKHMTFHYRFGAKGVGSITNKENLYQTDPMLPSKMEPSPGITRIGTASDMDKCAYDPSEVGGLSSWAMMSSVRGDRNSETIGCGHRSQPEVQHSQSNGSEQDLDLWSGIFSYDSSTPDITNSHLWSDQFDRKVFELPQSECFSLGSGVEYDWPASSDLHFRTVDKPSKSDSQQAQTGGHEWPLMNQSGHYFGLSRSLLASGFQHPSFDIDQLLPNQTDDFKPQHQPRYSSLPAATQAWHGIQSSVSSLPHQSFSASQTDPTVSYDFVNQSPDQDPDPDLDLDPDPDPFYPPLPPLAPDGDLEAFLTNALAEPHNAQPSSFMPSDLSIAVQPPRMSLSDFSQPTSSIKEGPARADGQTEYVSPFGSQDSSRARHPGGFARDADRDRLMLELKDRGMSYKDIKAQLGFEEAESTLRGRYRTMTKPRAERVRKPGWNERDIRILKEAVSHFLQTDLRNSTATTPHNSRPNAKKQDPLEKVSWKHVAEYMKNCGCYRYGNSTVKKKYYEVMGIQGSGDD